MNDESIGNYFLKEVPVIKIESKIAKESKVNLYLKREDLSHKYISGNKWRKLKYNLIQAKKEEKKSLLTFGGAYSNHIAAVAEAGRLFNFETKGIIRGEKPYPLNATLQSAQKNGMQLIFVSRSAYKNKEDLSVQFIEDRSKTYIIPEGGTNQLALKGCREIISHCNFKNQIDYWCVACGTGGTAAGMISALNKNQHLIGFSVLKGDFMDKEIRSLLQSTDLENNNWMVNSQYHFGGYAKFNPQLIEFINDFKKDHKIQLDPIYTGKLLYGVYDLLDKGFFPAESNIMITHTGGQQGIKGFNERFGPLIQ